MQIENAHPHRSTLPSILGHLPSCSFTVQFQTPTREVFEVLENHPDFPGVILLNGRKFFGVISRQRCFEHLGRPFGIEVYLRRPVRILFEHIVSRAEPLPESTLIEFAVQTALHRPAHDIFEPVLVIRQDNQVCLVDFHDLLLAHSQILISANQIIQQQLNVEHILFSTLEWDEVIDRIFHLANNIIPYDQAVILLDDKGTLTPVAASGFPQEYLHQFTRHDTQEFLAYEEIQHSGNALTSSLSGERKRLGPPDHSGANRISWLGLPFVDSSHVTGMLALTRFSGQDFRQDEVTIATNFCRQAVLALKNAIQFRQSTGKHVFRPA